MKTITNLRDMLDISAEKYGSGAAYLYKERLGGPYIPLSFEDFRETVYSLGAALLREGFSGCRMAVIGENRWQWVAAYFAVVCGLGVIVPLDKELPPQEIAALIRRADITAVCYSSKVADRLGAALQQLKEEDGAAAPRLISMDTPPAGVDALFFGDLVQKGRALRQAGSRAYDRLPIDEHKMCTLLFTSGTTGLAKGVMLSHANFCSNVKATADYVGLDRLEDEKISISILPMHHTYEFSADILSSLYQGGTVAFCEGLKHIVKNMNEAGVTYMIAVPLIFENMYKKIWKKAEKEGQTEKLRMALKMLKALPKVGKKSKAGRTLRIFKGVHEAFGGRLKLMVAGAAAIDPTVVSDFNAMGFRMVTGYGMTECSPIIALNPDYAPVAASAGLPLNGTELYIDEPDENGVGEIVCRSESVMLGYYKDEEETRKVLSPDGWLRTGDYGYLDSHGYVYITGRKKNVIVTKNGKNIFPEEVEYYLCRQPGILEAVVRGKDDERTGDLLVTAEIYPDADLVKKLAAERGCSENDVLAASVEACNDCMPLYKRIKDFSLRSTPFDKTTTQKIRRW